MQKERVTGDDEDEGITGYGLNPPSIGVDYFQGPLDENGDELVLYFIEQGDTCAMTITCCLGQSKSKIRAVAEHDSNLIMIPVQKMQQNL